jgi:prepilin-type N-terminal cleavage/methylation domain-containing protein
MRQPSEHRRGMTLVELLTVITIMTILIAVAIPVMRPALKDRKLREASRMLNTYIALAKAKATETGRAHGIWIQRDANNSNASYQIFLAETPVPFAGDYVSATAEMVESTTDPGYANVAKISDIQGLIQQYDFIRFNFRGPRYQITNVKAGPPVEVTFQAPSGYSLPPAVEKLSFQVFRKPVALTTQPLTLPTGTVIDLGYSGMGYTGNEFGSGTDPIRIMFQPGGQMDQLLGVNYTIPGTIHMLIGRTDGTAALETDMTKSNLADPNSSWVSIGHLTGTVTTAENRVADPTAITISGTTTLQDLLRSGRDIAQNKQTMGGR